MTDKFAGFGKQRGKLTPLPAAFFDELLPLIDDLAELKVTLFCFWALYQKEGNYRYLRMRDFLQDEALMNGLRAAVPEGDAEATLSAALTRACERGTLLCGDLQIDGRDERLYFMNTQLGRTAIEQIEAGNWRPADEHQPIEILPERPNIYRLYEENIGLLTPMIADALKDAEREYPAHWLDEAIRVAVESNVRNWRYVLAVLKRWQTEGRSREADQQSTSDGRRYITGEYADFIEH